jgi:hypothetical protein
LTLNLSIGKLLGLNIDSLVANYNTWSPSVRNCVELERGVMTIDESQVLQQWLRAVFSQALHAFDWVS